MIRKLRWKIQVSQLGKIYVYNNAYSYIYRFFLVLPLPSDAYTNEHQFFVGDYVNLGQKYRLLFTREWKRMRNALFSRF